MKKLFISQPMRDKTDEEILELRKKIVENVKQFTGEDIEVIDSFFKDAPHEAKPLWFLAKSLELLSSADCVYFGEGWQDYRGCRIEHECAVQYGIDIVGGVIAYEGLYKQQPGIFRQGENTGNNRHKPCRQF